MNGFETVYFSIIVPVFNVEKYLDDCIRSVITQYKSFPEFELILVDDGSTDSSGSICDKYAQNYPFIIVVHKSNGGLSDARNTGMKIAHGEYFVFLDSDDWIREGCLKEIGKIAKVHNPDVIETSLVFVSKEREIHTDEGLLAYNKEDFSGDRAKKWIIHYSDCTWPAPKRICARKYIINNELYFRVGYLQEDIDWTLRMCYTAKTFYAYTKPWYYYRIDREGSISNSVSAKFIIDALRIAEIHINYYKKNKNRLTRMCLRRLMISVFGSINQYRNCTNEDRDKVIDALEQNKWMLRYAPRMRDKLFALFVYLFGVKMSMDLLLMIAR